MPPSSGSPGRRELTRESSAATIKLETTETRAVQRKHSNSSFSTSPPSTVANKHVHICPTCQRSFSRAEHLERHLTTHLPPATAKTFICPSCSKGFTRKDV